MNLAARGKAFYILKLGDEEQSEMAGVNSNSWKAATFSKIHTYLQLEREKAFLYEDKLKTWFPHKSEEYFAAREHHLGKKR